ncbi:MAG: NAD(P)H-hydrate dehydratase [Clostridia bacterium]|nr:NAD(P)H-hydrate dehydratase [Clostridia bacterium]
MPKRILTPTEMNACDRRAIKLLSESGSGGEVINGSRVLMERAARWVYDYMKKTYPALWNRPSRILIICGMGNNGGDGYALAPMLLAGGIAVDILSVGIFAGGIFAGGIFAGGIPAVGISAGVEKMSPECRYWYEAAKEKGVTIYTALCETIHYDCIVDAVFGIGLSRPVGAETAAVIDAVNRYAARKEIPVVAVDIPSGIDALTGEVQGTAIRATDTVCISHEKRGLLLYPGCLYCGNTVVADIGIGDDVLSEEPPFLPPVYRMTEDDLCRLPARAPDGNKGTFGRAVILAGCKNMCGAAYLSALAAYRSGAGLVEIVTVEDNRIPLQTLLPEAVLSTYVPDAEDIPSTPEAADIWKSALARADTVVLGPGLGMSETAHRLVRVVLECVSAPIVVDADAINHIARDTALADLLDRTAERTTVVLTPHPGEFSRLTGKSVPVLKVSLIDIAAAYAGAHGVILIAKDARSVITDGKTVYLNTSGSAAMAKGGSGDVLTGITAALLAQNRVDDALPPVEIAALGAFVHGLSGERAEKLHGSRGILAREIADMAGDVMGG